MLLLNPPLVTRGPSIPSHPELTNLHSSSFRENFTFVAPLYFRNSVASDPAPPHSQWEYPSRHGEINTAATPEPPDPMPMYLFGRKDEIRDLEMEDTLGSVEPPVVEDADQSVSVSIRVTGSCWSTLNDALLVANFPSQVNCRVKIHLGLGH